MSSPGCFQWAAAAAVLFASAAPAPSGADVDPEPPGGVVATRSGLKYRDLKRGAGEAAKRGDRVEVHYTGWLSRGGKKGKKFDSSLDRKRPFSFDLGAGMVIAGWEEGVAGVKPGGKRLLVIPAALAYGKGGAGGQIPPDSDLIFEIEVLKIGR